MLISYLLDLLQVLIYQICLSLVLIFLYKYSLLNFHFHFHQHNRLLVLYCLILLHYLFLVHNKFLVLLLVLLILINLQILFELFLNIHLRLSGQPLLPLFHIHVYIGMFCLNMLHLQLISRVVLHITMLIHYLHYTFLFVFF